MYDTKKIIFFQKLLRETKKLYLCSGEMAERSNAAVLKTVVQQCTGGSNPSFSAEMKRLDSRFCSLKTLVICLCLKGGMPEWSNGAVSKTVDRFPRSEGSNPSPSAKENFLGIKLLIINDKAVLFFYIYTKSRSKFATDDF